MEHQGIATQMFYLPASVQADKLTDATSSLEFYQSRCYDFVNPEYEQRSGFCKKDW